MGLFLILAIGFYLYKKDEAQKSAANSQKESNNNTDEIKKVIDYRYASGQISTEEYDKLKAIL
ncbi:MULTISPECIES: hypothetical protein [Carnobacterium]|jgi:uncharacterized membrane protein|uniref:Short C-terminal domain-containing protein n=1 Tax=Carnobacterium alterfunditum TaxID=28230 RepID=A0A1N6EXM2_9LACT|nr:MULTISPECIES: hypothetical protein [Carnobacterium]MBT2732430.1 hypothetical protein [Carnobacterium sp. ISL-102]SIN87852.1 hypothetical protein SAMN05878443_0271 [Carnobacterium alterfunditum]